MSRRRTVFALTLAASTLLSAVAVAGDAALAEQLFEDGLALRDQGEVEQACAKFDASMDAEPSGGAALNVGRCAEEKGKTATAWAAYKRAVVLFRATNEGERRTFAEEQVARLEPTLSMLTIRAPDVDGLEVTRNGQPVPTAALGTAVVVDPGEQVIEARADGYEPAEVRVTVGPNGATEAIDIPALTPLSEGPTAGPEPDKSGIDPLVLSGGVLLGVGATASIVGGVIGGFVLGDANEARRVCGEDQTCDPSDDDQQAAKELAESAKGRALAADILVIGGAVVGVGGAALLIVGLLSEDDEPTAGWRLTPTVGPGSAGLVVGGSF